MGIGNLLVARLAFAISPFRQRKAKRWGHSCNVVVTKRPTQAKTAACVGRPAETLLIWAKWPYNLFSMPATTAKSWKPPEALVSEADAVRDFGSVLALVRAGANVVIYREDRSSPVAVISPADSSILSFTPARRSRTLSECITLLPEDSTAVMDADFARDIEAAIDSHREPLKSAWD